MEVETEAEARYVENLRTSAKILETRRKQLPAKKKKPPKSQKKDGEKGLRKGGQIMSRQGYPQYKQSGVSWLGEIPVY